MIHDRGKRKWSSLMLPEHVEMLQQFYTNDTKKQKPILSEDDINDLEQTLQQAVITKQQVVITYYKNDTLYESIGTIHALLPLEKKIAIRQDSITLQLYFQDVTAIEIISDSVIRKSHE
ncbi:YolD-like family protein [Gracilibacillus sp. S3-1-1]|uniref:YolD-like family protein n=1 Tax=Gracilibacillus pellucidus TaxID=3095368 RepID=A0ACC6M5D5_9BACI|nr:YolD-like family protein [Gracilibacillus sp. S3-1-1]MDX8046179.1 YolD-like family protein [Gracilibacillus sp. S3-1-1]